MKNQHDDYEGFVEKFKPKKTTDDCYTPDLVYEAVKDWAVKEYGLEGYEIIRPFWPGADFTEQEYPEDGVVIDNPPFSILSKICEWYLDRGIKFFLFAPSLTALTGKNIVMRMNHLICDAAITYDNEAVVRTSFVTNMGDPDIVMQTAPSLSEAVNQANDEVQKANKKQLPKYDYPDNIVTAALFQRYCKYGVEIVIKKQDCVRVSKLDSQRAMGKTIFGGGLMLSSRAAAEKVAAEKVAAERAATEKAATEKAATEKAAAEKAAVYKWELSEREKYIVAGLDKAVQ